MKLFLGALIAASVAAQIVEGSFLRDVVAPPQEKGSIEQSLLAKAIPLEKYRANLRANGYDIAGDTRSLEENANNGNNNNWGDDDYYMDSNDMFSFSGYSLKYGACQPVQQFSEDAIDAGEYTPLVTDDIVILRLCPSSSCSSNRKFGCSSNYAEYAVSISDYVRIMLRHKIDKKEQLCNWCNACAGRRRLEGDQGEDRDDENQNEDRDDNEQDGDEQEQNDENQEDDAEGNNAENQDANQEYGDDGNQAAGDDAYNGNNKNAYSNYWGNDDTYGGSSGCSDYKTYCYESGVSVCADDDDNNKYLDAEGYLDYVECRNVNGYYLRPRCNGYDQSIKMAIYYDQFCSQYAGNQVSMSSLGLGMSQDAFKEFYSSGTCVDCSENVSDKNTNVVTIISAL